MKIGLYNLEPKIVNTAMMQVSTFHKNRGDKLWDDYRIEPFVMPYDKFDDYQRKIARWCNNKIIFKSCSWEEYMNE